MDEQTIGRIISSATKMMKDVPMSPRYNIHNLPYNAVGILLKAGYEAEVRNRRRILDYDQETSKHLQQVARWFTDDSLKSSLLLYGGVGNGKTTMLHAIQEMLSAIKEAVDVELNKSIRLHQLKIYTAQEIANCASENKERYEAIGQADFLAIDDLGCEPSMVKNFGTEVTPVVDIIYKRYNLLKPTIITTNLTKEDIRKIYGPRVMDRIEETYESIAFTNKTYRQ